MRREEAVEKSLKSKYPEKNGYKVERECILRDKNGTVVRD
jgi:hypothetical protein